MHNENGEHYNYAPNIILCLILHNKNDTYYIIAMLAKMKHIINMHI